MNYSKVAGQIVWRQKNKTILAFVMVLYLIAFAKKTTHAQTNQIVGKSLYELRTDTLSFPTIRSLRIPPFLNTVSLRPNPFSPMGPTTTYQAPVLYQVQDLAFFCRLEVKMEKASKIPVRFRLGSVDYVDYMEGKREKY